MTLPVVVSSTGLQPQDPASLRAQLVAQAEASSPGLTTDLPGSLIEDIASTATAALVVMDTARVDLVNSLTPVGANPFLIGQLGQMLGVPQGQNTNTSVFLVFSSTAGQVIAQGFTVTDGTYQYVVQDGGLVQSSGMTLPLFAVAVLPGSWVVPAGTVTQLVTAAPPGVTITVTNPLAGISSTGPQTEEDYRAQVLQANRAASQGMTTYLKTLLVNVPGVQSRLVSARQVTGGWEIICGGGDPYLVAQAIFEALFDISTLVGSTLAVTSITNANPGVVTTSLNHGYATGRVINISGVVGMSGINNTPLSATVTGSKTFSIGIDTTGAGAYVSGGVVTPNLRNITVSVQDYPDVYQIPYVNPPQQVVAMSVTWNTTAVNFTSAAAVAQLAQAALVGYVNSLATGQPLNLYELQTVFQTAVASILPGQLLTRMVFAVSIDGVGVTPTAGTGIMAGDPESYFTTTAAQITVAQG